jgi:adenylate cyclase
MARGSVPARRSSILALLLVAFLLVSVVPIGILAALSFAEERAHAVPVATSGHSSESGETGETGETGVAGETAAESLLGVPIFVLELGLASVSLVIAGLMAVYIGRRIVRPIRELEASMGRVEAGDLHADAPVRSNDEIGRLASSFNRMLVGLRREALIRDLFGQYVTPEVARVAIESEGQLEGQVVECSIVFADIRGFTALAEILPAHRLVATLNSYLAAVLSEVAAEGGIVNKFGGDSVLAVFGSPLNPASDHPARAVRAAVRMRSALADFNRRQAEAGLPTIRAGFGVATGDVIAGNIGSQRKVEYTVIGDAVNLAARLEELTRDLGVDILIAGPTAERAQGIAHLTSLGERPIRGRAEPVPIFAAEG